MGGIVDVGGDIEGREMIVFVDANGGARDGLRCHIRAEGGDLEREAAQVGAQPFQLLHIDVLGEEIVDDVIDEFGGRITREARDDETWMGKTEVRERGGGGAIVEARSARGGEEEESALVSGDRKKEA